MDPPLISIITPTFNSGAKIAATIASVLSQKKELYEFLIIDGGSTDDTPDAIEQRWPELEVMRLPNIGFAAANNAGFAVAR